LIVVSGNYEIMNSLLNDLPGDERMIFFFLSRSGRVYNACDVDVFCMRLTRNSDRWLGGDALCDFHISTGVFGLATGTDGGADVEALRKTTNRRSVFLTIYTIRI
jgi:hypothetical protein